MKMNTEDDFDIAARYRTIRKHLDSLGYKYALSLDTLPLIEKLLADLIQTTESLKHFKSIAQENIEARSQLQLAVDPYKCDNARLVQECNQLHSSLIKAKECHWKQIRDSKKEIHKLERECNDLQLASSRNLHRIKELEVESSKKSKKILELQGKCLKPTISNAGLAPKKRSCYPLRKPILENEPLPKTGAKTNPLPTLTTTEPKIVDLLNMADRKMNCLTVEVTKLKGELSLQTDNIQTLKSQLTAKEKEIIRLKKMLEGGRPYSAVFKDCACKKNDNNFITSSDHVSANELQILQQEKLELEHRLKEALNKQHDAMSQALKLADRNEELEKELRDIDRIALAVEADCNSAVKENNKRVSKLQQKLQDVTTQIHVLEGELTVERREVQELRADLEACKLEKRNIQRNLESALDEKKQMTDRINKLTVIEKNLNDEIERLAKENEKQRQDVIQLQYSNKLLKEQIRTKEHLPEQNGIHIGEVYKERVHRNVNGIECESILKQLDKKETQIHSLEQAVEQTRRERDFYKDECNNTKDYHSEAIKRDNDDLWTRIRELKRHLSEKENALDELQREKKELIREKSNLETRLENYKTEEKISHRPCNACKHGTLCKCSLSNTRDTGKTKGTIERLEHERDIARADVERLIEERDALRERLKMAAEAHTSEQRRLRENLTQVETRVKQIEKERQEVLLAQGARKATINGLEDQLQDLREELKRTKEELGTQRTQYFQLRALQDQTDQALGDAQNQLTQSESELNKALDRNRTMERLQLQLENQVRELQQEINNYKGNMTHLDHEKDQLLMVLDEKTEKIAALEREIMAKDQQLMGSEQQIHELQHKNEICVDQSAEQGRQLRSMQLEMENLERQLQSATYDRENAIQENRRVQDDLAAVTCELRNMQRELDAARAESYDLKRQLQTYVSEVRRVEELLNRKENERSEMLNHFRSLSLEATVLENNNHSLESEAAEARGALRTAKDQLLDMERQLADKDGLIRGYETQISELTQNIASMETQLRQQGEQRHRAEADLNAVRDLCVKLDQQKETLVQQLDDKDALRTQYDAQIAKLKAEQTIIHEQMNRDRATVERLEMLLDQAKQESITVQANNQELQNEMSRLRQKMSELQNKLSSESAKLRQYQTQAAEYCKQISELRRQVTNERFDRARKDEESRRHLQGTADPILRNTPPPSNNRTPNGSNDATHRYLQKERSAERDIAENSYKFNDCPKDVHRDVPRINVILRSDCTIKSNRYNCSQRETTRDKKKNVLPKNQDSERTLQTDLESSLRGTVQKKKDAVTFIEVDVETKYTNTLPRSKLRVIENSSKPTSHKLTHSCVCPLNLLNTNKNLIVHKIPSDTKSSYDKTTSKGKQLKDSSGGQRMDFCANINYNSTDYPLRNIDREIEDGNNTVEEKSVGNVTTNSYLKPGENFYHSKLERKPKSTVLKGLSFENIPHSAIVNNLAVAKSADICTNANCNSTGNVTLKTNRRVEHENAIMDEKSVIIMDNYSKSRKSVHRNKSKRPVVTVDTTLDMLQSILEGVNDANNKTMVKCKNIECNYGKNMQNVENIKSEIREIDYETLPSMELTKPECMRMLTDIEERTKILEEQLTLLNKDTTIKKRINEKCTGISERRIGPTANIKDIYSIKQQRDIITQQPEKENVSIQEPSQNDIRHVKCVQDNGKLELKNIVKLAKVKKYNLIHRIDKKDTLNQQINVGNKNDREQQENINESLEGNDVNNLKKIENVQDIRTWSASSSILDPSNFKPLTLSTPTKMNLESNKECSRYISCSTQTNTRSERNLQMKQFKKSALNESMTDRPKREEGAINLTNVNADQDSPNCQEKTIITMLLTRGVSNAHLKSRYKKLKFTNFRPTCIIDSCIVRDRISMKSKLPKRKMQIPTVFRELKSVVRKVEDRVDSGKPTRDDSMAKDGKVSDLLATVYTQSSNLYITTATSVSRVTFNNNNNNNNYYTRDRGVRTGICTLN